MPATEAQKAAHEVALAEYAINKARLDAAKKSGGAGMVAYPAVEGATAPEAALHDDGISMPGGRGSSPQGLAKQVHKILIADIDEAATASLATLCRKLGNWQSKASSALDDERVCPWEYRGPYRSNGMGGGMGGCMVS